MYKGDWRFLIGFTLGVLFGLLFFHTYSEEACRETSQVDSSITIDTEEYGATAGACNISSLPEEEIPEVEETAVEVVAEPSQPVSLGEFRITYYDCCEQCCGQWATYHTTFTGTTPTENHTVAVDPSIIPLGTKLIIWGEEYIAEDTGAFQGRIIDIYVNDHNKGWELLAQKGEYVEVYMKEDN